jgi:hypothetical protein
MRTNRQALWVLVTRRRPVPRSEIGRWLMSKRRFWFTIFPFLVPAVGTAIWLPLLAYARPAGFIAVCSLFGWFTDDAFKTRRMNRYLRRSYPEHRRYRCLQHIEQMERELGYDRGDEIPVIRELRP